MAKGFNKVVLMGNLTRDPELRTTSNGTSVCGFSLAVNRTWRNAQGEQQEAVDFVDCTAWGKAGEIISQYMQKGRALLVSGRLQQNSWEQDGKTRTKIEVVVEDFNFVDGGGGGDASSSNSQPNPSSNTSTKSKKNYNVEIEDVDDDKPVDLSDIPF